jgi:exopolysaccharide biosynthesis predicted pyruvyltransferase EpsI
VIDPLAYIVDRLGPGGRCVFMPNGGNLGDSLIAAATIQRLDMMGLEWHLIRGRRGDVTPRDVLVFGGGGSLVMHYQGGIECVQSLQRLGAPVVVLPQSCSGHESFWQAADGVTVFCRDRRSFEFMSQFRNVSSFEAHDMAIGLDLSQPPFSTVSGLRAGAAAAAKERVLLAWRTDSEAQGPVPEDTFDVSAAALPQMASVPGITADACAFLGAIATHSAIRTDRLHVGIAGALLGIPTELHETRFGKNKPVYEASIRDRFPHVRFVDPEARDQKA